MFFLPTELSPLPSLSLSCLPPPLAAAYRLLLFWILPLDPPSPFSPLPSLPTKPLPLPSLIVVPAIASCRCLLPPAIPIHPSTSLPSIHRPSIPLFFLLTELPPFPSLLPPCLPLPLASRCSLPPPAIQDPPSCLQTLHPPSLPSLPSLLSHYLSPLSGHHANHRLSSPIVQNRPFDLLTLCSPILPPISPLRIATMPTAASPLLSLHPAFCCLRSVVPRLVAYLPTSIPLFFLPSLPSFPSPSSYHLSPLLLPLLSLLPPCLLLSPAFCRLGSAPPASCFHTLRPCSPSHRVAAGSTLLCWHPHLLLPPLLERAQVFFIT